MFLRFSNKLRIFAGLPAEVGSYTDLVPLEPLPPVEELPLIDTSTYKATHTKTGVTYCLRRIHGRYYSEKFMFCFRYRLNSHFNSIFCCYQASAFQVQRV